jgi:hypothetical protein
MEDGTTVNSIAEGLAWARRVRRELWGEAAAPPEPAELLGSEGGRVTHPDKLEGRDEYIRRLEAGSDDGNDVEHEYTGADSAISGRDAWIQRLETIQQQSNLEAAARATPPTGWSWYSSAVTTPKLPPPPRIAQKRFGGLDYRTW